MAAPAPEPATTDATAPSARSIDGSCPAHLVPPDGFLDVPEGSGHGRAIACLVWWRVVNGRTADAYAPREGVNRDAMAAFVARAILASGGWLPQDPPDAFRDDDASVHEQAINQLAAVGVIGGTGGGNYSPGPVVNRGQMARFLANAAAHRTGRPLPAETDFFHDDAGSPFEASINQVAAAGITGGRSVGAYEPAGSVTREQMASFLARLLDVFVADGLATTPAA